MVFVNNPIEMLYEQIIQMIKQILVRKQSEDLFVFKGNILLDSFFNDNISSSSPMTVNEIEPSSSGGRSKSGSIFDGAMNNSQSISLTIMTDNIEASKEGRRAGDRSWRGAWVKVHFFLAKKNNMDY